MSIPHLALALFSAFCSGMIGCTATMMLVLGSRGWLVQGMATLTTLGAAVYFAARATGWTS